MPTPVVASLATRDTAPTCSKVGVLRSRTYSDWTEILAAVADGMGGAILLGRDDDELVVAVVDSAGTILKEHALGRGWGQALARHENHIAVGGHEWVAGRTRAILVTLEIDSSAAPRIQHPAGDAVSAVTFDSTGTLTAAIETPRENAVRLLRFDVDGDEMSHPLLVTAREPSGAGGDPRVASIVALDAGVLLVAGSFSGTLTIGGRSLVGRESSAFLARVEGTGRVSLLRLLGGPEGQSSARVIASSDGFYAVHHVDDAPPGPFWQPVNVVLTKLDADGRDVWQKRFRHDVEATGFTLDARGRVVLSGRFAGAIEFGAGVIRAQGEGYVAAFDPDGTAAYSFVLDGIDGTPVVSSAGHLFVFGTRKDMWKPNVGRAWLICPPTRHVRSSEPAIEPGSFEVLMRYPLESSENGVDGRLELVGDSRVPLLWAYSTCFYWRAGRGLGEDFDTPPRSVSLRVVDANGKILDRIPFQHPLARIEPMRLYGTPARTFALVVNDSLCFGRWRGFLTRLFEVRGGRLHELRAVEANGGRSKRILFRTGLSGDMRMVSSESGLTKDILYARAWFEDTTLERFSFEDGRWVVRSKAHSGMELLEPRFPDPALFPRGAQQ